MLKVDSKRCLTTTCEDFKMLNHRLQCDRYLFIIWTLAAIKICPIVLKFAKVGIKVCLILNKPSNVAKIFKNFQSD